ncbi:LytR cell envelope-related transcriptional attenuator [Sanguibacter gelidistatuariae]|uniref:LytR cell envelope-related transcriptional attenuator n=1 Tax=Sanguibacter gelidistatuariae TaxID=1814289 RepID=A0A1G6GNJ0_9MICO|nr:LytR C-terminal domain-containing protein [Sanguibacter gelidistatuariae]SDB83547.1 LytR cell envelope-related transcriptional attenuator [Sanguibacter gelidistatuariae]
MTTPDEAKRARAARRRHKHERQAVVFGVLIAFLAVSGLAAAAIYTGAIDPPFARDFTAKESTDDKVTPQPCLPADTLPVPYSSITIRVLNGTDRAGLASSAADDLAARGFVIESTGNSTSYTGVQIAFGSAGLASAYTLAAHLPEARFIYDDREDASLDLYLGKSFTAIADIDAVNLDPTVAMASIEGCTVIESLTPTPRATTAPPAAPSAPVEEAPAG